MAAGKAKERDHDAKLASGAEAHLTNIGTLKIDGQDYTLPEVITRFDDRLAILDKATDARNALKTAVQAEKLDRPVFKQFASGFTSIVLGMFRNDPKTLADFDVTPRKSTKAKISAKAVAVDKALATRKARNTMGKVQKKAIKGVAPQAVPANPPAAVPPAPSVTPEPVPAKTGTQQ